MLQSYLKIAFRNLWKHKLFSFINIFGLAAGMTVSILALVDLKSAYDYDLFHPFPQRTYRIITDITGKNNEKSSWGATPAQVAGALKKYPFTEAAVQVYPGRLDLSTGTGLMNLEVNFIDQDFFRVFGFKMQEGRFDPSPYNMVLSTESVKRFFGNRNPLGKTLKTKNGTTYTITGILAPPPGKSHLGTDAFIASSTLVLLEEYKNTITDPVNTFACYTYILLGNNASKEVLSRVLPVISAQTTEMIPSGSGLQSINFRPQPLDKINPDREGLLRSTVGGGEGSEMTKILVQMAVGLVTLLLAGFNYINLTLARSVSRSREVGVRKVIGAGKWQLVLQFIMESVIISLFALALSYMMIQWMKPLNVVDQILRNVKWDLKLWSILGSFTIVAGTMAGIIPAMLFAAFNPVTALKGQPRPFLLKGLTLRKALVVAQFAISLTGLIFILVMYQQQKFMAKGAYGFKKELILNIDVADQDYRQVTSELVKEPGVEQVTATSGIMGLSHPQTVDLKNADKQYSIATRVQSADANFLDLMELKLLSGENIPASTSDSSGNRVLLNEEAIRQLHLGDHRKAVGQLIWLNDSTQVRVAGIVKDFHYMNMAHPILPLMIRYEPMNFRLLQVKVAPSVAPENTRSGIRERLSKFIREGEQDIAWFDQQLYDHHFHANDQLFMGVLTGMVLSIACLGLLGMVTYTSETRTKEVGIRKVMGASVSQVVMLLSKDFIWLLAIAALLAFPVGMICGVAFLNNFAYHITMGTGTVITAFLFLFVIGGLTIGWQAYRAASSNPVVTLRTE